MSTTPLPPPLCIDDHEARYSAEQMQAYAQQARADLEAEVQRFREHLTKQNAELDELIPMAQKLEAENQRLREALEKYIAWCDAESDGKVDFWERVQMCRDSEAAARAALESKP